MSYDYNGYAAFTEKTAIYPQQVAAEYLALGLCSEAAECVELIDKLRNAGPGRLAEEIGGEIGDVLWYCARMAVTFNFDFHVIVGEAKKRYDAQYSSLETLLRELTVDCGLIAGKIKKQLRDGHAWNGEQREEARQYIAEKLIHIITTVVYLSDELFRTGCRRYGNLERILDENRAKLESRLARNVLSGDGSYR